jgi:hypothetical protein
MKVMFSAASGSVACCDTTIETPREGPLPSTENVELAIAVRAEWTHSPLHAVPCPQRSPLLGQTLGAALLLKSNCQRASLSFEFFHYTRIAKDLHFRSSS